MQAVAQGDLHHSPGQGFCFFHLIFRIINCQESTCRDVPVEMCELVDFTKCQEVPKKFCQDVSYEECKQSPEEVCWDVPGNICKIHTITLFNFIFCHIRGGL